MIAQPLNFPLIIGHRGSSALLPENTLASFKRAFADGADGIEFDVQLAADGVPVVFHDETLKRIAGRNRRISELTSAELSNIDAGSWFRSRNPPAFEISPPEETIPTLEDVMELFKNFSGRLYIELKCDERSAETLTDAVCEIVRSSPLFQNIVVKSFELSVVRRTRFVCPAATTAALFAPKLKSLLGNRSRLIAEAHAAGADELSIHYSLATAKLVKQAAEAGLPVTIWTADHPRWVEHGRRLGLKAIITNDPGVLIRTRNDLVERAATK